MSVTDTQLLSWLEQFLFPFLRIGGVLMVAPLLGSRIVPAKVRLLLALLFSIILAPLLPPQPAMTMLSATWCITVVQQMAMGIAIGFVLQVVFESVMVGGELVANSMGLGFAQLADPVRGAPSPVVGQFLLMLVSLLFLSLGGHLSLVELLARSFQTVPIGTAGLTAGKVQWLAALGGQMFASGVQLALPVMIGMLVINLAMGVVSRSAPALNLMAVGFPVALLGGLVLWMLSLSNLHAAMTQLLDGAWQGIGVLIAGDGHG
jgi:flagellar biosynthetic protein FliR